MADLMESIVSQRPSGFKGEFIKSCSDNNRKEIIKYTNCVFVREPLTYIDLGHGDGRNY